MSLEVLLSRICAKRSLKGPNHTIGGKEGWEEKLPLSSPESQEPLSSDSLIIFINLFTDSLMSPYYVAGPVLGARHMTTDETDAPETRK